MSLSIINIHWKLIVISNYIKNFLLLLADILLLHNQQIFKPLFLSLESISCYRFSILLMILSPFDTKFSSWSSIVGNQSIWKTTWAKPLWNRASPKRENKHGETEASWDSEDEIRGIEVKSWKCEACCKWLRQHHQFLCNAN